MTTLEIVAILIILCTFGVIWFFMAQLFNHLEEERKKKSLQVNNEAGNKTSQQKKPMLNNKKTYITWFIILVLPPILVRLGVMSGNLLLSEDLAQLLTIITKIGLIALTIWYALKLKMSKVVSIVLGLSTLVPFMPWVSLVILLMYKPKPATVI